MAFFRDSDGKLADAPPALRPTHRFIDRPGGTAVGRAMCGVAVVESSFPRPAGAPVVASARPEMSPGAGDTRTRCGSNDACPRAADGRTSAAGTRGPLVLELHAALNAAIAGAEAPISIEVAPAYEQIDCLVVDESAAHAADAEAPAAIVVPDAECCILTNPGTSPGPHKTTEMDEGEQPADAPGQLPALPNRPGGATVGDAPLPGNETSCPARVLYSAFAPRTR